jgi:hypothetical protein
MSWRDDLPVHPAADLFPMMPESDLIALGEDIKSRGMKSPIAIRIEKGKPVLLDGRNRLDAMERAGLRVRIAKDNGWTLLTEQQREDGSWVCRLEPAASAGMSVVVVTSDPIEFITSANVHRRHLMPGQKRDVVAALLKEKPERSDRATAELAKVDHKTVAAVRRREEDVGSIPHVDKVVDAKGRRQPTRWRPRHRDSAPKPKTPAKPTIKPTEAAKTDVNHDIESFCAAFGALELARHNVSGDNMRLAVNALGEDRILRLVSGLKLDVAEYGTPRQRVTDVKSAADRAEARAKSTL